MFQESVQDLIAAIAEADEAEADAFVGADRSERAQGGSRARRTNCFGEISACPGVHARIISDSAGLDKALSVRREWKPPKKSRVRFAARVSS